MFVDLDFETANLAGLSLKKVGAARYSEDFWTEILSLTFHPDCSNPYLWAPGQQDKLSESVLSYHAAEGATFVSHGMFEQFIWANIMVKRYSFPPIPIERWIDTQALCAYHSLSLKLDGALKLLQLPVVKDEEGRRITLSMSPNPKHKKKWSYEKAFTPERLARVYSYNAIDVEAVTALRGRLPRMPDAERAVWELDQKINWRGVGIDLLYVRACQRVVEQASVPLVREFKSLTGGFNPTQRDKLLDWCQIQCVSIPDLKKETLAELIGDDDDGAEDTEGVLREQCTSQGTGVIDNLPGNIRRALVIRKTVGSAAIKKLTAMEGAYCLDGRARGLFQYHAALPGRWAGRIIQPQNFPRGSLGHLSPDEKVRAILSNSLDHIREALGVEPIEAVVSSLRHAFLARVPGRFSSGDFSSVEARLVLALAGQYDKCDLLASGQDVYLDLAGVIFGVPSDGWDVKGRDLEKRQTGKNGVLSCGFQVGGDTLGDRYCGGDRAMGARIVTAYRDSWAPLVPKLWKDLFYSSLEALTHQGQVIEAKCGIRYLKRDCWLQARLLDGKLIHYFNPILTYEDGRPGWKYVKCEMGQNRWVQAYGGILTQNVIEGLARQLLCRAMLRLEAEGYPIAMHVTDEIVVESDRADAEEVVRQVMEDRPQWAKDIRFPCAVETWSGERYRK